MGKMRGGNVKSITMKIIGHHKQLAYFETLQKNNTLHHAYLFVGPEHVGKTTLAKQIIANIFEVPLEKLAIHPDFLELERVDEDGKLKRDITVEHIQAVLSKASRSPIAGKYNIVLIPDAEKMNAYAANSLLKTLEEPATPTLFFLLTNNEEKILETIKSRVQTLAIAPIPQAQLLLELKEYFSQNTNIEEIAVTSRGLSGLALEWLQNPEAFDFYKKERERFFSLFNKPFFEKLALVEPLFGDKKAHIEGREELIAILHIWQECLHSPQLSSSTVVALYDIIVETIERLGKNIHPRLLLENLLLSIP